MGTPKVQPFYPYEKSGALVGPPPSPDLNRQILVTGSKSQNLQLVSRIHSSLHSCGLLLDQSEDPAFPLMIGPA